MQNISQGDKVLIGSHTGGGVIQSRDSDESARLRVLRGINETWFWTCRSCCCCPKKELYWLILPALWQMCSARDIKNNGYLLWSIYQLKLQNCNISNQLRQENV